MSRRFFDGIVDLTMVGYRADTGKLQLSAHVLNLMCDLSECLYHAMAEGGDIDVKARTARYQSLQQWSSESLPLVWADRENRPEMYRLR